VPIKTTFATTVLILAGIAGLEAGPTSAHHSWSAEYDLSRSTYVSGTVARVLFHNPHSAIVLVVNTEDGRQERWTVHWASPQRLRERGVTDEDLRVGDELMVTGNPHRDDKVRSVRAVSVRRGDGTEIGRDNRAG
jgi:Family of unknown function (DUF6152)